MRNRNQVFAAAALTLALFESSSAQGGDALKYNLAPSQAKPDSGFSLWLLSEGFTCATSFTHQEITVSPSMLPVEPPMGTITLSFVPRIDPAIRCAQNPGAIYGPKFRMPALKRGVYTVNAVRKLPCQVEPPICGGPPDRLEPAGTLRVETGGNGWFIKPRQVRANAKFNLEILNEKYGDCNWAFTDSLVDLPRDGSLHLAYVVRAYPERLCLVDNRPFGPRLFGQSFAAGKYPVYLRERRLCELDNPPCLPQGREELVDTLFVSAPLPLAPRIFRFKPPGLSGLGLIEGYRVDGRELRPALGTGKTP